MFAEETPGLEGVPTGLAGEQDLLVEVELNVGLDITQSLLSQSTEAACEGGIGVHVEVLVDLLIHLGEVENVLEVLHGIIGKQNILLYGEVLTNLLCFGPFLFQCIRHLV